jgi:site-specific DNA-methyltransferase (cytosine-N4-specific)
VNDDLMRFKSRPRKYRGREYTRSMYSAPASVSPVTATVTQADAYDGLSKLAGDSVDLLCTSPPYWGLRTYGQEHNQEILDDWHCDPGFNDEPPSYEWYRAHGGVLGMEPLPAWYVANLVAIFERARHALKEGANVWINLGDTYFARWSSIRVLGRQGMGPSPRERRRTPAGGYRHDKQLLMIPARFAIAMQEAGWIVRNDLIWSKPHVAPRPETDRLRLSHEHFFHFVQRSKGRRPTYYYDLDGAEHGGLDVVSVRPSPGGNGHPATFPQDLVRPRIRSSCPPGGTICDPFCGLGTSLQAALELGRNAVGFDLSQTYVSLAQKRLSSN